MVYKRLTRNVHQRTVTLPKESSQVEVEELSVEVEVTTQSFSTAILRTCKLIDAEAREYVDKELALLDKQPLRIHYYSQNLFNLLDGRDRYKTVIQLFPKPRWSPFSSLLPPVEIAVTMSRREAWYLVWVFQMEDAFHDLWYGALNRGLTGTIFYSGTPDPRLMDEGEDKLQYTGNVSIDDIKISTSTTLIAVEEKIFNTMLESWARGP